jgi:hypothetical protein
MSGEVDGDDGVAVEPVAEPDEGGVLELEDGEEDGVLEVAAPFLEASSPQAARASAAAAAISRALVIPVPLRGWGSKSRPAKMTFHAWQD